MYVLKKYGVATKLVFPLYTFGTTDYATTIAAIASGDAKIMKDEGSWNAITSDSGLFVSEGEGFWSVNLTTTEMEFATGALKIVDQTGTKLWEDQSIVMDTYGHASAEHGMDLDLAQGKHIIETQGSYTEQQALSLILSMLAGRSSGSGLTFKTPDNVATRAVFTVDGSKNRDSVTLTPSS